MASRSFQERFKNRTTTLTHNGILQVKPECIVQKPNLNQLHENCLKSTGNSVIRSSFASPVHPMVSSEANFSSPYCNINSDIQSLKNNSSKTAETNKTKFFQYPETIKKKANPSVGTTEDVKMLTNYAPYTLSDYRTSGKDYFSGIGASTIGSNWGEKNLGPKKWIYEDFGLVPSSSPIKGKKDGSEGKTRKIEFIKSIVRPPLKLLRPFGDKVEKFYE